MKLDAIGIVSKDLKKSVKFYELLGFKFSALSDDHLEATTESGLRIMLDTEELAKKLNPNWIKPVGQKMGLAFLCDSPQKVDDTFQMMTQAGFQAAKEPWDAFWGQRYASIIDPDGNSVDLFAPL